MHVHTTSSTQSRCSFLSCCHAHKDSLCVPSETKQVPAWLRESIYVLASALNMFLCMCPSFCTLFMGCSPHIRTMWQPARTAIGVKNEDYSGSENRGKQTKTVTLKCEWSDFDSVGKWTWQRDCTHHVFGGLVWNKKVKLSAKSLESWTSSNTSGSAPVVLQHAVFITPWGVPTRNNLMCFYSHLTCHLTFKY